MKLPNYAGRGGYLTKDAPPVLAWYRYPNQQISLTGGIGLAVHHPKLGLALKQRMDALGIECVVQYQDEPGVTRTSAVEFIKKQLAKAERK